jgi:ribosome-associated toxin RatA of RatAB toxin-antitoxin module
MKSYKVTETIHAGPDEVWRVLSDVARYPDWDSG